MNNGRVVHFEDDPNLAASVADSLDLLSDDRHRVVGGAADLAGALALLDELAADPSELEEPNVVVMDGNLSNAVGGKDARTIRGRIEELGIPVRVVVVSSQSVDELGVQADAEIPKKVFSVPTLVEVIDGLEEPTVEAV